VGAETEPLEILEQGSLELGTAPHPVVVLDAQQDVGTHRGRHAPDIYGIRHVTEMEVSGRRRGEPRPRHSVRSALARSRSRASSARVAAKNRRYSASRSAWASGASFAIVTRRSTSRSRSMSLIAR